MIQRASIRSDGFHGVHRNLRQAIHSQLQFFVCFRFSSCLDSFPNVPNTTPPAGQQFQADCYGCLNTNGCYYCPEDGTCDNSDQYISTNRVKQCTQQTDYLSFLNGDTPDKCISPNAKTQDPQYDGSAWMYEMINAVDVWEQYGLTGEGVTVRINDDGVYVDNREFEGRFAAVEDSCPDYLPLDEEGHGTSVAGIILGNRDNDLCAAGIAPNAKFSSCNFFADNVPVSMLAYQLQTFDISQNSIGMPYVFFLKNSSPPLFTPLFLFSSHRSFCFPICALPFMLSTQRLPRRRFDRPKRHRPRSGMSLRIRFGLQTL